MQLATAEGVRHQGRDRDMGAGVHGVAVEDEAHRVQMGIGIGPQIGRQGGRAQRLDVVGRGQGRSADRQGGGVQRVLQAVLDHRGAVKVDRGDAHEGERHGRQGEWKRNTRACFPQEAPGQPADGAHDSTARCTGRQMLLHRPHSVVGDTSRLRRTAFAALASCPEW